MRAVVQRVHEATVRVDDSTVGQIGLGLLVLLGLCHSDGERHVAWLSDKIMGLRIFPDAQDKMSRSLADVEGGLLVVSQFTLYGSVAHGLRPDFQRAAPKNQARVLYEAFIARCRDRGHGVETGLFGARMQVSLTNFGPVTLILDTDEVMGDGK